MRRGLGDCGTGVKDAIGDILGPGGGPCHEYTGNAGLTGVQVLIRLIHVGVAVQPQVTVGEESLSVRVGSHSHGQHHEVVLGVT